MTIPNEEIVAKVNLLAANQRRTEQTLATDLLSRQSVPGAGHIPVGVGAQTLDLLPPDRPNGSVLTLDSTHREGVRWGAGFPGPDSGTGVWFGLVFSTVRWQAQVGPVIKGIVPLTFPNTITSYGVFGVPNTPLTGTFDRLSWDLTADPSASLSGGGSFNFFTFLEPGIYSIVIDFFGITASSTDDFTQPWSVCLVGPPYGQYAGSTTLLVPPRAPVHMGSGSGYGGPVYPTASFTMTELFADPGFQPELLFGVHLNSSYFFQHQIHGRILWLGPLDS